jgi:hypothetical protein
MADSPGIRDFPAIRSQGAGKVAATAVHFNLDRHSIS